MNQSEFLSATLCYGLMLSVDWFQPYDHFTYSIGVIYLVIMNLPRAYRYKRQNIIRVGIIPGPSEPPLSINSYLTPLVTELLQLWVRVQITLPNSDNKIIRAALLAVAFCVTRLILAVIGAIVSFLRCLKYGHKCNNPPY